MKPTTKRWLIVAALAAEIAVIAVLTRAGIGAPMAGIVVRPQAALVEADNQTGVMGSIKVIRVVAPADSWIVVRRDADGVPGMPVGTLRVRAGTTTGADVKLDAMGDLTPVLWVSLFADRGRPDVFEANMADMTASRDKPYVVDGHEVVARIGVVQAGVSAKSGSATVSGARLSASRKVTVAKVTAPGPSWLVVEFADGTQRAGEILGIAPVARGTWTDIAVPMASDAAGSSLQVTLRADAGKLGRFDMIDDEAYRVASTKVSAPVASP